MTNTSFNHDMDQQLNGHGFGHVNPWLESFVYSSNDMKQQLDHDHHDGFGHVNSWLESFDSLHDRTNYQPQHSIQENCPLIPQDITDHYSSNQVEKKYKNRKRRPNIWYWPESSKTKAHSKLIKSSSSQASSSSSKKKKFSKAKYVLVSKDVQNPTSPNREEGKMIGIKNAMECIQEFQNQVKDLSTLYISLLREKLHETVEVSSQEDEDEKSETKVRRGELCQSYTSHIEQYRSRMDSLMKYHFNTYMSRVD